MEEGDVQASPFPLREGLVGLLLQFSWVKK